MQAAIGADPTIQLRSDEVRRVGFAEVYGKSSVLVLPSGIADGGSNLLQPEILLSALGVAIMSSLIPYSLELEALRRMPAHVFGVLMSLEPAVALAIGAVMLGQRPAVWQLGGVLLVVAAGVGAERHGRRAPVGAVGSE